MNRYDCYKDSEIRWLGDIPSHWEVKKLGNFLRLFSEKGYPDAQLLSVTREKGVILRDKENKEENHNFVPDDLSGYKHVHAGDFVINKMKSWQGSYGVSNYEGIVSPAYFTCTLKGIDKEFFSLAIRAKVYTSFFMQYSKGIRVDQWDLEPTAMKSIPIVVPPIEEQQKIVSYLNKIVPKIEESITLQQKMIDLLNERKQIIIHNAVTNGLDSNAPMKDSGIEWIGKIPEHWDAVKLKNCIEDSQSGMWGEDERHNGEDKICIRVADFDYEKGCLKEDNLTYRWYGKEFTSNKQLKRGDLLLEKSGGGDLYPVGRVVRYSLSNSTIATCSNFVQLLRIKNTVDSDYLYFLFRAMYYDKVNGMFFNQTTGIQNLKVKEYLSQTVFLPPKIEQIKIAEYLNQHCKKIEETVSLYRQQVQVLRERKQIIINEVVTGKVKIS